MPRKRSEPNGRPRRPEPSDLDGWLDSLEFPEDVPPEPGSEFGIAFVQALRPLPLTEREAYIAEAHAWLARGESRDGVTVALIDRIATRESLYADFIAPPPKPSAQSLGGLARRENQERLVSAWRLEAQRLHDAGMSWHDVMTTIENAFDPIIRNRFHSSNPDMPDWQDFLIHLGLSANLPEMHWKTIESARFRLFGTKAKGRDRLPIWVKRA